MKCVLRDLNGDRWFFEKMHEDSFGCNSPIRVKNIQDARVFEVILQKGTIQVYPALPEGEWELVAVNLSINET